MAACPQPDNRLVWVLPLVLILLILLVGILGLIIAKIVLMILVCEPDITIITCSLYVGSSYADLDVCYINQSWHET